MGVRRREPEPLRPRIEGVRGLFLAPRLARGLRHPARDRTQATRRQVRRKGFHTGPWARGGAGATRAATLRELTGPGPRGLDVGSGLGGSARHLAAARGCRTTDVDRTRGLVGNLRERRVAVVQAVVRLVPDG